MAPRDVRSSEADVRSHGYRVVGKIIGTPSVSSCSWRVARYFFDTRDNDVFIQDEVGMEFGDLGAVRDQAALSLAELARDVLPGSLRRKLAVEVRDESRPVIEALLTFEAIVLV